MTKLFALYDLKAQHYLKIFPDVSTASALRSFAAGVNESQSVLSSHPDDFCLMELATFDTLSGTITPLVSPLNLGSARTVLREPSVQNSLPFAKATQ